jgi:hypothetical protein
MSCVNVAFRVRVRRLPHANGGPAHAGSRVPPFETCAGRRCLRVFAHTVVRAPQCRSIDNVLDRDRLVSTISVVDGSTETMDFGLSNLTCSPVAPESRD